MCYAWLEISNARTVTFKMLTPASSRSLLPFPRLLQIHVGTPCTKIAELCTCLFHCWGSSIELQNADMFKLLRELRKEEVKRVWRRWKCACCSFRDNTLNMRQYKPIITLLDRPSCPLDDPVGQETELNWTQRYNLNRPTNGHLGSLSFSLSLSLSLFLPLD